METERALRVQQLIDEHGTETALLLLNQNGYLRWVEGKEIREVDIKREDYMRLCLK